MNKGTARDADGPLLPQHADMMDEAAITREVALAASVRSVTDLADLPPEFAWLAERYGPAVVPALVFPYRRPDGQFVNQLRPDVPLADLPKYIWPARTPPALNVHPDMAERAADPDVPLLIVEGTKQYLAAVSALDGQDVAAVGISGCRNWTHEGAPIADLAGIGWDGRDAVLANDADLKTNRDVWDAADGLAGCALAYGAARVRHLDTPGTAKAGLDDVLARVKAEDRAAMLLRLIASAGPLPRAPRRKPGQRDQAATADPDAGAAPEVPVPADGAALLDAVRAFAGRYMSWPSPHAGAAYALWIAHCHAADAWESTPRLALLSPEPGSGKTRALEVAELITPRPLLCLSPSPASVFRTIELARPTLLIDETDAIFTHHGRDDANEDLRALLNAGHRKGARVPRCVGQQQDVKLFPVYAPVALAGLGDLPATLMTRSVVIRMRRRAPGEHVEDFRYRDARELAAPLAASLAAWARHHAPALAQARPVMPPGITDRPADVWEPLLAIADAAGGHWPATARAACLALAPLAESGEASLGVRLLADLWTVFGGPGTLTAADLPAALNAMPPAMATADILGKLNAMAEAPWATIRIKADKLHPGLDARGLAMRLKHYDVEPKVTRIGDATPRGYRAADLFDPWMRYVLASRIGATAATPQQPQVSEPAGVADVAQAPQPPQRESSAVTCDVAAVADVAPMRGEGTYAPPDAPGAAMLAAYEAELRDRQHGGPAS
jgi:hypothetical protein